MGERVAAMIFNGLGFVNTRLYMFPEFFRNKPLDRLFGRPIEPEYFNDDALGRCLDAIYDYGVTKLFTEIALTIGIKKNLLGKSVFDTTPLQLWGNTQKIILKIAQIMINLSKKTLFQFPSKGLNHIDMI